MSDETQAVLAEGRKDWIAEHREMYLNSGGAQGHIMDITAVGVGAVDVMAGTARGTGPP